MEIKLFKLILNILIIPLMVVSISMIVNGNIIGIIFFIVCLNPCCSGRWSRTRPYKTLLIINKLKNFTK